MNFITIAEKIHCSISLKIDNNTIKTLSDGTGVIFYDKNKHLSVPKIFTNSTLWNSGKVKPCAVAIWQGINGASKDEQSLGENYLNFLANKQEENGADFLDLNIDEYSFDINESLKAINWLIEKIACFSKLPISIDSSNLEILRVGAEACKSCKSLNRVALLNSASLERLAIIDLAASYNYPLIISAAGKEGLQEDASNRLANIDNLLSIAQKAGIKLDNIYIDPLVYPIATSNDSGKIFFNIVKAIRNKYGQDLHITAGISNISFGMPNRKLLNQVFTYLAINAGLDSGIVDPASINKKIIEQIDITNEGFILAKNLLMGEDEFGMEYISACREGLIK